MGKHSRKRQRTTEDDASTLRPLGSVTALHDDASKDDEERRLESLLFGTPFVATDAAASKSTSLTTGPEPDRVGADTGGGLDNLLDSDLFYLDYAGPSTVPDRTAALSHDGAQELDEPVGNGSEDEEHDEGLAVGDKTNSDPASVPHLEQNAHRKHRAAWADPDDQNIQVSLSSDKRLRKLRDAPQEDAIGGRDYEARLRRQYEKIHPVPEWAATARQKLHPKKRQRRSSESSGSEASDAEDGVMTLLSSSGTLLSSRQRRALPQGQLSIERLRDANQSAKADGEVKVVMFHPSPNVPVLLTASADRRLRLFNIDGHTNPHLQTVHIPSLPITSALFHPTGDSVLLTGHRPFYYTYDLKSGACIQSPRGLWGTHASNQGNIDLSMGTCAFSQTGDVLAVAGRKGYTHLVDWRTGGGQVVGTVKMNAAVKDLWWTPDGKLMSLGEDAEVYMWDVGQKRCVRRWKDDGGFGSLAMSGAGSGAYLAIGSKTGLVNLYGSDSIAINASGPPKPLKTIANLTTSISTMRFNPDAQILALASKSKKDQLKMVHLPSMTVFSNWPTSTTPLGHISSIDFSAGSEYAAIGNNRGRVLLYNLKHFGAV